MLFIYSKGKVYYMDDNHTMYDTEIDGDTLVITNKSKSKVKIDRVFTYDYILKFLHLNRITDKKHMNTGASNEAPDKDESTTEV